jgi:hypothetical protein
MGKQTLSFEDWKYEVNKVVLRLCGMECDDLPDFDYYASWMDGRKVEQTAKSVVRRAKADCGL